jgi:hypothetical protein
VLRTITQQQLHPSIQVRRLPITVQTTTKYIDYHYKQQQTNTSNYINYHHYELQPTNIYHQVHHLLPVRYEVQQQLQPSIQVHQLLVTNNSTN